MTGTPRCQVVVMPVRGVSSTLNLACGLPLEPTGGPCVTCGHKHGRGNECGHPADGLRGLLHWCECRAPKPAACPVHGAATDGGREA